MTYIYFLQVFQAGLFYAPHVLLKLWKHPLLEQLVSSFRESLVEPDEEETIAKRNEVAKERTEMMSGEILPIVQVENLGRNEEI